MKKLALILLLFAASALLAQTPGVTVTGTLLDSHGNPTAGTITFTLANHGQAPATVGGTYTIANDNFSTTAAPDGTFSISLFGNYQIDQAGTYYAVKFPTRSARYQFTIPGSFNIAALTPYTSSPNGPIALPGVASQAYVQSYVAAHPSGGAYAGVTTDGANGLTILGGVSTGSTLPTILGDGISPLTCPGAFASLNACLTAAANYATTANNGTGKSVKVFIPAGTYTLTSTFNLVSGMQIYGVRPRQIADSSTPPTTNMNGFAPNGGTWIDCGNTICFTGSNLHGAEINGIGFKNFTKALSFGGTNIPGMTLCALRDLLFLGNVTVNSSPKAIELYNPMEVRIDNIYATQVNIGLHIIGDHTTWNTGNSVISEIQVETYAKSAANGNNATGGIQVEGINSGNPLNPNLLTFIRPQVNTLGGDSTAYDFVFINTSQNRLVGVDAEGTLAGSLNFIGSSQNYVDCSDCLFSNVAKFDSTSSQNVIMTTGGSAHITDARDAGVSWNVVYSELLTGAFNMDGRLSIIPTKTDSAYAWSLKTQSPAASVAFGKFVPHSGNAAINFTEDAANGVEMNGVNTSSGATFSLKSSGTFVTAVNNVSYSATPTFDLNKGNVQMITMTGNVTGVTINNRVSGQVWALIVCQDATGGRTWNANVGTLTSWSMPVSLTASECTEQMFVSQGGWEYPIGPASISSGNVIARGMTFGSGSSTTAITTSATAARTVNLPDASGTFALNIRATSSSIGGSALTAGQCSSTTVSATGATTSMPVSASPVTYPGDGFYWVAYVSAADTVTVKVCAAAAGTPTSSAYNVSVEK